MKILAIILFANNKFSFLIIRPMLRVVGVASCRCCELSVLRVVVMRVVSVASCQCCELSVASCRDASCRDASCRAPE